MDNGVGLPLYILNAMEVMQAYSSIDELPLLPPIVKNLPLNSSGIFKNCFLNILVALWDAYKSQGLSDRGRELISMVFYCLPRFLFVGLVRDKGNGGDMVNSFGSVMCRVKAFIEPTGPRQLWRDHIKVGEYLFSSNMLDVNDKCNHDYKQAGSLSDNEVKRVVNALGDGDIFMGSRAIFSEYHIFNFQSVESASEYYFSKYSDAKDEVDRNLIDLVENALSNAYADGTLDKDDKKVISFESTSVQAKKAKKSSGPDLGGWRPYFVKLLFSFDDRRGGVVCTAFMNEIVSGSAPNGLDWFLNSFSMHVFQHNINLSKFRLVNPCQSVFVTVSSSALMSDRKEANLSRLLPLQLGVGCAGGADIMCHLSNMVQNLGATEASGLVEIQADLESFFYNIDLTACFKSLIKAGDLSMLRAVWFLLGRGGGKISCRMASGLKVFFQSPNCGLPVGHPFSAYIATLVVAQAYNSAFEDMVIRHPTLDVGVIKKRMVIRSYVDDFKMFGVMPDLCKFLPYFTNKLSCECGTNFSPDKGYIKFVSDRPMSWKDANLLYSALFLSISDREGYLEHMRVVSRNRNGVNFTPLKKRLPIFSFSESECAVSGSYPINFVRGIKFMGVPFGDSDFMEEKVSELRSKLSNNVDKLSSLPAIQHQVLINRFCLPQRFAFLSRMNGCDPEVLNLLIKVDECTSRVVQSASGMFHSDGWCETQEALLRLPIKSNGLGVSSAVDIAPFAFFASFLCMARYVIEFEPSDSFLRSLLDLTWSNKKSSPYAEKVHCAIDAFLSLFESVEGRSPEKIKDGFSCDDLISLTSVCNKFQKRAKVLLDKKYASVILSKLPADDRKAFQSAPPGSGSISFYTAMPVQHTVLSIPNQIYKILLQDRLFHKNVGGFVDGDVCPGVGRGCRLSKNPLTAAHMKCCVSVGPKGAVSSMLHEGFRSCVFRLLRDSGVWFDSVDLTAHKGVQKRLRDVGAVGRVTGSGVQKGADILIQGVMEQVAALRPPEEIIDVTVISGSGTGSIKADFPHLKKAEFAKSELYGEMYGAIGIPVYGLAMDTAGRVGPNVLKLISSCESVVSLLHGARLPSWANWTCNSFRKAWLQMFIVSMQCLVARKLSLGALLVRGARGRRR